VARKEGSLQAVEGRKIMNRARGHMHKDRNTCIMEMKYEMVHFSMRKARRQVVEQLYDFCNFYLEKYPYVKFLHVACGFSSAHYCLILCKDVFWVLGQFGTPHICFVFNCRNGFF
jgi:hypothetical protein